MSNALIALFLAAGIATYAYTKLGARLGYGNAQNVWIVVGAVFVLTFAVVIILPR